MALANLSAYDYSSSNEDSDNELNDKRMTQYDSSIRPKAAMEAMEKNITFSPNCRTAESADTDINKTKEDPFSDEDSDTACRTGTAYFYGKESSSREANDFDQLSEKESSNSEANDSDQLSEKEFTKSTTPTNTLPNPLKLPTPTLHTNSQEGTVFANRYADNEKAKFAVLEKHVAMTEETPSNNKVCFKFRQGLCKRGKNCRYSHDLGIQAPGYLKVESETVNTSGFAKESLNDKQHQPDSRRRPGVTNTLNPAKRAKKSLDGQRRGQRPWTVGL